jgi:hypothetical protein
MIIETFKPTKKILHSKVNCIFFLEIEPEKDGLLEMPLSPSEDVTLSIYSNVAVNIEQKNRIYSNDANKEDFHIELFHNEQEQQHYSKIYNGAISEISVLFPQSMLKYFFKKMWIPSPEKPFKTIDKLSLKQKRILSELFLANDTTKKVLFVQQFLCLLSASKTTHRFSE